MDKDVEYWTTALREAFDRWDSGAFEKALDGIVHTFDEKMRYYEERGQLSGTTSNEVAADAHVREHAPFVLDAIDHGAKSERGVADYFNAIGKKTRRNNQFSQNAIHRLIKKAQKYDLLPADLPFRKLDK